MKLSRRKKVLFAAACTAVAAAFAYAIVLVVLSEQLYRYVTTNQRGVQGRVQAVDERLGYAAIPGAAGAEVFPIGADVPIRIDARGFRVPVDPATIASDAGELLALGCSFTFGAACVAEDTFAERIGRARGLTVRNAGGNGYGLVQMLLLAREHVPSLRPTLVLVQFAEWLVTRARNDMAPSYYGRIPVPYFAATDDERLEIAGPVFRAKVLDLPISEFRAPDAGGRWSFFWRCGAPLTVHDHWHLLVARLSAWPPFEPDRAKVVRLCYGEIAALCSRAGARAVVVCLGSEDPTALTALASIPGLELVHAERDLRAALPPGSSGQDYERAYGHWRGDPPQLVDRHPNALAHERIAASVLRALDR